MRNSYQEHNLARFVLESLPKNNLRK
jgi:hypothetical protein